MTLNFNHLTNGIHLIKKFNRKFAAQNSQTGS